MGPPIGGIMGRRALPHTYLGITYPSIGWALGDALRDHPTASDQQIAEILDTAASKVQYWRTKIGVPEFRKRDPRNPYMEADK